EGSMPYGETSLSGREGPASSRLRDVVYSHEGEEQPTIRGVTIDVEAGSTTALVGPTGSGKTTLTTLALRRVDADRGSVRIDDVEARELAQRELPAVATLVAQQTFMFDDSVRGNITLGEESDDESLWESLRIAQADGFVSTLPKGIDTVIGERG